MQHRFGVAFFIFLASQALLGAVVGDDVLQQTSPSQRSILWPRRTLGSNKQLINASHILISEAAVQELCAKYRGLLDGIETKERPHDPHDSSSGYYDGLGNPISEEDYLRQAEFEKKHGVSYYRDRAEERRRPHIPLSVSVFSSQQCDGERALQVTEQDFCYGSPGGKSYYLDSVPSDCELTTFVDGGCMQDSYVGDLGGFWG